MPLPYTVKAGDNLSVLARQFGVKSGKDLYNLPANAGFRAKRPNPNVIQPGDTVMLPPLLIAYDPDSRTKPDLDSTPNQNPAVTPATLNRINSARGDTDSVLEDRMLTELSNLGGAIGTSMAQDFFANNGALVVKTHGIGSPLSTLVESTPEFKRQHAKVQASIRAVVKRSASAGGIDYAELDVSKKNVNPPSLRFGGMQQLHVLIGSFQGVSVYLVNFSLNPANRTYSADVRYEFFDHFGADDGDANWDWHGHGSPGQVALWVLQRERHPGHMPYITQVVILESIIDDHY